MTSIFMRRPHLDDLPVVPPLPEGYALRQAFSPQDDAPLAAMLAAAFGEAWDVGRVRSELTATPDVRAVYVITDSDRIVATASNRWVPERDPDAGCVHWVGTHPDYLRRGLASALLAHLLGIFHTEGRSAAILETQDFRLPAIRAYLKFGFLPLYEMRGADHHAIWSALFRDLFNG